jgi:hypothetical protein
VAQSLAPSDRLRKCFNHEPAKWGGYREKLRPKIKEIILADKCLGWLNSPNRQRKIGSDSLQHAGFVQMLDSGEGSASGLQASCERYKVYGTPTMMLGDATRLQVPIAFLP